MYIFEIGREMTKIQEREHCSINDILSCIPVEYSDDMDKVFRFLTAWNSLGRFPEGLVL